MVVVMSLQQRWMNMNNSKESEGRGHAQTVIILMPRLGKASVCHSNCGVSATCRGQVM
jgi:hypothetical protein